MAHLDLEEQEQLAQLKSWWATYGTPLITLIFVIALLFSGWQGWRWWQASQSAQASTLFEALTAATRGKDAKMVRDTGGELLEKFPGTAYAPMGALMAARYFFDRGDVKDARAQLQWVVDQAKGAEFRDVARLRLANVLLDEKKYDEAMALLEAKHGESFDARYALLKGDILSAKGQGVEAKSAYKLALEKTDKKDTGVRDAIQMRIDALGG